MDGDERVHRFREVHADPVAGSGTEVGQNARGPGDPVGVLRPRQPGPSVGQGVRPCPPGRERVDVDEFPEHGGGPLPGFARHPDWLA